MVTCTAPSGGGSVTVEVTVVDQSATYPFTYAMPVINSIESDSNAAIGDGTLTLTGTSFGGSSVAVTVGDQDCAVISPSDTQVTCDLPAGTGLSNNVVIVVDGLTSNTLNFAYAAPVVTSYEPTEVPCSGGTVTIHGANFGVTDADVSITLMGGDCVVTSTADDAIECTLPTRATTKITTGLLEIVDQVVELSLSYVAPVLTSVTPGIYLTYITHTHIYHIYISLYYVDYE